MVQSLPRSRAHATRAPMSGLPRFSSQAFAGSSDITQVIERLTVPCCGIGSIGVVVEQAAAATQRTAAIARLRMADTLGCCGYGRTGSGAKRDALPGLRLSA